MDVDAFTAVHGPSWSRLEALCKRSRLTTAEADELLDLYQRTTTHLSLVRSATPDPYLVPYLSWLVTRARTKAYAVEVRRGTLGGIVTFFTTTFPAALYRSSRWWVATLVLSVLYAVVVGWWFLANPDFTSAMVDDESVRRLVEHDFENYYSEYAASSFAFQVFTNNAWVGAQAIAFGIFGAPVVWVLHQNMLNLALSGALMIQHGRGALFFGLITPHGLLELTAVFVAAGVGLRLFWSWVDPGPRSRFSSLGAEARTSVGIALGLVVVFAISGVIEGFVTPSGLSTAARIGIGVAAEIGFLVYVFVLGRRAAARGATGDVTGAAVVAEAPSRA
ncbi:stage II sporulation protein M [Mobilicoccus caccae]|uniref:Membrane protein n=1 Tax=Mobilicoccus caccae TaxID=1859295 RepID=A0ABQ6IPA6_9MICO|nr:stage II sporulation protein M [Mobilicoccus caccae]GMA38557.1 membrane protein [Mobilicoccus caccae]